MTRQEIGILIIEVTVWVVGIFIIGCSGWIGVKLWRGTRKKNSDRHD